MSNKKNDKVTQAGAVTELSDAELQNVNGGFLDYDWIAVAKTPSDISAVKNKDTDKGFTAPGDVAGVLKKGR